MIDHQVTTGSQSTGREPYIITGGSSGIGKQVAIDLLRLGAHVAIVADQPDRLSIAAEDLQRISPRVWSHACDVSHVEDIRQMAQECTGRGLTRRRC